MLDKVHCDCLCTTLLQEVATTHDDIIYHACKLYITSIISKLLKLRLIYDVTYMEGAIKS